MVQVRRFGDYCLGQKIGAGGMSQLYRARKVGLAGFERVLAIKTILPQYAEHPDFLQMFINEAKLASLLHHSNIVQILDLGCLDDIYYIAMEYVFGLSVAQIARSGLRRDVHPSTENVVSIVLRIAAGLDYAHQQADSMGRITGVVHRDVTPHNILVSFEGEAKLVDFGIAKARAMSPHTRAGVLKGKIAYMSPEQASGGEVDHRTDIYSLGIVFHELLCRRKLFTGESEMTVLERVVRPHIEAPSTLCSHVPPELDQIVMRALAPEPAERYPTAGDMAADLEAYLRSQGSMASSFNLRKMMRTNFAEQMAVILQELNEEQLAMEAMIRSDGRAAAGEDGDDGRTLVLPGGLDGLGVWPDEAQDRAGMGRRLWAPLLVGAGLVLAVLLIIGLHFDFFAPGKKPPRPLPPGPPKPAPVQPVGPRLSTEVIDAFTGALDVPGVDVIDRAGIGLESLANRRRELRPLLWPLVARAHYRLGLSYQYRDPVRAEVEFRLALKCDPLLASVYLAQGRLFTRLENYGRAIKAYHLYLRLRRDDPTGLFNLGYLLWRTNQYRRAAGVYRQLVSLTPPFLDEAYVNLGVAYFYLGRSKTAGRNRILRQAILAFRRALTTNPRNMLARKYLAALLIVQAAPQEVAPPIDEKRYLKVKVKAGYSLPVIAQWYTGHWTNWKAIARANGLLDPNKATPNRTLRIPKGLIIRRAPIPADFARRVKKYVPRRVKPLTPRPDSRISLDKQLQFPPVGPK